MTGRTPPRQRRPGAVAKPNPKPRRKPQPAKSRPVRRAEPPAKARKRAPSRKPPARKPPPTKPVRKVLRRFPLGRASRRLRVGFLLVAFVVSVFAGRLLQLQGLDAAAYADAAVSERLRTVTMPAERGSISDVNGVPLATTVDTVAVTADPTMTRDWANAIAEKLAPLLGEPVPTLVEKLRKPETRFVYLARRVPPETWSKVQSTLSEAGLVGVFSEPDPLRSYPSNGVAANVVGFVGGEGKGLAGLEYAMESKLRGEPGEATYEIGASGRRIPLAHNAEQDPVPGRNVRLTIDRDIQWVAQRAIAEQVRKTGSRSGDVVVLDTKTGELVALATAPSFDSNDPGDTPSADRVNRPLEEVYEPGSVAKVLTASALIDGGYVTPGTKIRVPSSLNRDGRAIGDYWGHGTIDLTFAGAFAKSSNIGTVLAAERMPKEEQGGYLERFGLGKPTGIGFPGESKGLLAPADGWSDLTRATISFGQGVSVNAVQLASAIGAVANGGVRVEPSLVKGYVDEDGDLVSAPAPKRTRVVSEATATTVARMMEQVVQGDDALATAAAIPGYRVAGKTGTAQRVDSDCGCYRGYTASFAGFAPADDPRFVAYVVLQDPKGGDHSGSGLAAPVFHEVMAFALQKYAVPPTGARSPKLPLTW